MGVLKDHHLDTGLSLGQARVLFELGQLGPVDMHALRAFLALDAGYLSRLLGTLQRAQLIQVSRSVDDGRARKVVLTPQGHQKLRELDEKSDQLVERRTAALDDDSRRRLVECMSEIRRLLSDDVTFVPRRADSPEARACLAGYFSELARRFPHGFEPAAGPSAETHETSPPFGAFLIIDVNGLPRGCGALKTLKPGIGEIKRMWIHPELRGHGIGRRLLNELETHARQLGHHTVRLDTNSELREAISMYQKASYIDIPPYNDNPYARRWFEKRL